MRPGGDGAVAGTDAVGGVGPASATAPAELRVLGDADLTDEFDLDLAWGELVPSGRVDLYLPTGREVPGETCDTHNATCPDTCHATCPRTCPATCANTCGATCGNTCGATCGNTCGATCFNTCGATCGNTCNETCRVCQTVAKTHCFTCNAGCIRS